MIGSSLSGEELDRLAVTSGLKIDKGFADASTCDDDELALLNLLLPSLLACSRNIFALLIT